MPMSDILCNNLKACADRLVAANIYKLLPEIGMNIGYMEGGDSVADVCDIPGRIRRVEEDCCYVRAPKMGGSTYMAQTLLAIRKKFPQATVVANLRSNERILAACEDLEFNMVHMPTPAGYWQLGDDYFVDLEKVIDEAASVPGAADENLPDVITIPDRINLEKLILVVSASLEDFEDKILALNSMV